MRLAIVATHPIQYYAPWFAHLARRSGLVLKVFYLWNFGVTEQLDTGFRTRLQWDVPLLEGYEHEFVPNLARRPGTDHFLGLRNPDLARRVRSYAPSAVLLTTYNFASIASFLLRWRNEDAPLIFRGDSHLLVPRRGMLRGLRRRIVAGVFRRFAAALYVGSANREYFLAHGMPSSKLFHAPHAVDNDRFLRERSVAEQAGREWRQSLEIPDGHRVVLFAGKFEAKKRPLDLLEAFLAARIERALLLFVGGGALEAQLRARAAGRGDVKFAPFQNQSLMPRTYAACDLFVLPSVSESWGLAVNEAMCMGRTVIVSHLVGCASDLVHDGVTGLTFEAGNTGALEVALKEALADSQRLALWGENARRHIAAFNYEAASAGLLSALAFAASDTGAPSVAT